MFQHEEWRPVVGYEKCYLVSDQGHVVSLKRSTAHLMFLKVDEKGYTKVQLSSEGRARNRYVHRLVAEAFHGPCPDGHECRHLNGDKADNRAVNLRWGTPSQNEYDKVDHGTHQSAAKTHCPKGHPYDADNTYRRPSRPTSRDCRSCHRARYQSASLRSASVAESAVAA